MTQIELKEKVIKTGDYGCLVYKAKGVTIRTHGKVKYIDSDGIILFKDDFKPRLINSDQVIDFIESEMLPAPTEHSGRSITFDNGRWIYTESSKEVDLKR
jgi:hypothetical protein